MSPVGKFKFKVPGVEVDASLRTNSNRLFLLVASLVTGAFLAAVVTIGIFALIIASMD